MVYAYFASMNPSTMCANTLVLKTQLMMCVLHFQTMHCSAAMDS